MVLPAHFKRLRILTQCKIDPPHILRSVRRSLNTDPYKLVKLVYWEPANGTVNFGDLLSNIVVSQMLSNYERSLHDEVKTSRRLLAIGSILQFARDNDVIWGSGVNGKLRQDAHTFTDLDVRAVRGPLTADFLHRRKIRAPEIYGDPALLLPRLFPTRFLRRASRPYVVVPNLFDLDLVKNWDNVVSPLSGWNRCVTEIVEAEFVIASSLHGIIIAEAYGIPARQLRISETEAPFKYQDYYEGTGRTNVQFATSIPEALEMGGAEPAKCDLGKLVNAFPLELWD
jgi:pyruvyltransferase